MTRPMNDYDKEALRAILEWERRRSGFFGKLGAEALAKIDAFLGDYQVVAAMKRAMEGIVSVLNDGAAYTVRPEAIFAEYRQDGRPVYHHSDIATLPLQHADITVGRLALKYKSLAATEGAAEGAASMAGPQVALPVLLAGLPVLMTLTLRAVCEYAVYYGFDIEGEQERGYALQALNVASMMETVPKLAALGQLSKTAHDIAVRKTWAKLNEAVFAEMATTIGRECGLRITKAKLAQAIPVVGIVIGGGFNAYFMGTVCEAAGMLYRKRFLARAYDAPELLRSPAF